MTEKKRTTAEYAMRRTFLADLSRLPLLPSDELELFEWYFHEIESMYKMMLVTEQDFIQEQVAKGIEDINDSGMVPIQYFIKRSRYSHIIYLASLGEKYLADACARLTVALGDRIVFALDEINGEKWVRRRKFLERYGHFVVPEDTWAKFYAINEIRNELVHNNGEIEAFFEDERKKVRDKLKRFPGVNVESYCEMDIRPEYIESSVTALRVLVGFIDSEIESVIARTLRPQPIS